MLEKQKTISDPIYGVRTFPGFAQDIASSAAFGRLRGVSQTSFCNLVFPNMTHTRYAHSIGVFLLTHNIRFKSEHFLTLLSDKEKKLLSAYALLHDIGHVPFSHILEPFGVDHKKIGLDIVESDDEMDKVFARHKLDKDSLLDLMHKKNPLHKIVTGGLFSSDKLDYMVRDSHFSGNVDFDLRIDDFLRFVFYDKQAQDLCLDQKKITLAQSIVNYYMQLYRTIYLRKSVLIANRMFHKAVELRMREERLKSLPTEIIKWTDAEFYYKWLTNTNNDAVLHLSRFNAGARNLHKSAIVIKRKGCASVERAPRHKGILIEENDEIMNRYGKVSPFDLSKKEEEIAEVLGIYPHQISLVPNMFGERFNLPQINIAFDNKIITLDNLDPEYAQYVNAQARKIPALRLAVSPEIKSHVLQKADKVLSVL